MATTAPRSAAGAGGPRLAGKALNLPPVSFFVVSAIFHYLGPALAVLLFAHVAALGVMWLRIAGAAVVFAAWRRPWRLAGRLDRRQRSTLLALGIVLAGMNAMFYLAIARLPLATVGAIEFLGTVVLAALGARSRRNIVALALTVTGVAALTVVQVAARPLGIAFAFGNCAGFMLYVVLGHRVANTAVPDTTVSDTAVPDTAVSGTTVSGTTVSHTAATNATPTHTTAPDARRISAIDQLGASMLIAAVAATPVGFGAALPVFAHPAWLAWGIGVGVCSSVIPYVTDQLAMARLPRATFALMLALLPAFATIIGAVVLGQIPTVRELAGIGLVIVGVAIHRQDGEAKAQQSIDASQSVKGRAGVPGS
ncbi:MAG: EamA family transporter [Trebonia sp.]